MTKLKDAVDEVLLWMKRLGGNSLLTRPIVKLHMNEAMKEVYQWAVAAEPTFYTAKNTFASTALLAYPNDYRATLIIEITDSDCVAGFAAPVKHREYAMRANSATSGPDVADPIAVHTGTGIIIAPARQGTQWFLRTVPHLTDDDTDLEQYLPFLWIEELILKTMELARLRTTATGEIPTASEKGLQMVDFAHRTLKSSMEALKIFSQPMPDGSALIQGG